MEAPPPYTQFPGTKPVTGDYGYGYPGPGSHQLLQQQQQQPSFSSGYGQPYHPLPHAQMPQPQQQVVVVATSTAPPAAAIAYNPYPVSMTGAFVLSCFVFWCFGWLFGGIAFILAAIGSDSSTSGDVIGALRLRNASYGVSVAGIIIGIIVYAILIWAFAYGNTHSTHG